MPHLRLVVIDDQAIITELVARAVEPSGFTTVRCHTATELWDACDAAAPTVILVDVMMPGVDGVEIVRELARRDCRASVLLMSGSRGPWMEAAVKIGRAFGLQVFGALRKPFSTEALRDNVCAAAARYDARTLERDDTGPRRLTVLDLTAGAGQHAAVARMSRSAGRVAPFETSPHRLHR